MRYILWVVALLKACDVTNNGRHLGRQELPRIGNQVKTARNGNFWCFTCKITHKETLCMILATRFTFIVQRSWKNMHFHPKLAWPPATYDVISRYHSNWPSLNSSQNLQEGWTNSYWIHRVLMFYPLGKNSEILMVTICGSSYQGRTIGNNRRWGDNSQKKIPAGETCLKKNPASKDT